MRLLSLLICLVLSISCRKELSKKYQSTYSFTPPSKIIIFAVHPLHNPTRLYEVFHPLMKYLSHHISGYEFVLEASRDYAHFDKKMAAHKFDFALPNPYQTYIASQNGYHIFAKMGDDFNFKGILVTRKDSGIKRIKDLKGKTICFPAPTAIAATMMPQFYLHQHGINLQRDVLIKYVGSQESSIMGAYNKTCAVSGTWPPPWELLISQRPKLNREMKIIWETLTLPNNGLIYRDDVPLELVNKVQKLLVELGNDREGKKILEGIHLSKFVRANKDTYKIVGEYISNFTKQVRDPKEAL